MRPGQPTSHQRPWSDRQPKVRRAARRSGARRSAAGRSGCPERPALGLGAGRARRRPGCALLGGSRRRRPSWSDRRAGQQVAGRKVAIGEPSQRRCLSGAAPMRTRAAGTESAARRRRGRARDFALQQCRCRGDRALPRHRTQPRLRIRVCWPAKHLRFGPDLDDLAEVHHRDPVAPELDQAQVVRDEDQGVVVPIFQIKKQVQHLGLD